MIAIGATWSGIRNPVKHLDHVMREVVRYFDIPADAIDSAARSTKDS